MTRERGGRRGHDRPDQHYDAVADATASLIIRSYSSSFWLASRLLAAGQRRGIHNIYALVRLADEIVDAPRPGQGDDERRRSLEALATATATALRTGSSENPVVHAFARTAGQVGIDDRLVDPFFASMRSDVEHRSHDEASLVAYIHGSAEVIGMMCLRVFLVEESDAESRYRRLAPAACRLGAAFQKVNFLRDIGTDHEALGRSYLPGLDPVRPEEAVWQRWLDEVDADLMAAAAAFGDLPRRSRIAVCAAHDLFAELALRLRDATAAEARTRRVRVPDPVKLHIVTSALARGGMPR